MQILRNSFIRNLVIATGLATAVGTNVSAKTGSYTPQQYKEVTIKVGNKQETCMMEPGSSFENKDYIYRMNNAKFLVAYDKKTGKWITDVKHINLSEEEYQVFKAIANNHVEKEGKHKFYKTLSHEDINTALIQHKNNQLVKDLSLNADPKFVINSAKIFSKLNGVSANITQNHQDVIASYGSMKEAVTLSNTAAKLSGSATVQKKETPKKAVKQPAPKVQNNKKQNSEFADIKIKVGDKTNTVKIQKSVSFENKGNIYRVNENGKLMAYNKSTKSWTPKSEIKMTNYQFAVFKAIANNQNEDTNSRIPILSKEDIKSSIKQFLQKALVKDLSEFTNKDYNFEKTKAYSKHNGFSTYITNGKPSNSASLVVKYGSADEAVDISNLVNKTNAETTKKEKIREEAKKTQVKDNFKHQPSPIPFKIPAEKLPEPKATVEMIDERRRIQSKIFNNDNTVSLNAAGSGDTSTDSGNKSGKDYSVKPKTKTPETNSTQTKFPQAKAKKAAVKNVEHQVPASIKAPEKGPEQTTNLPEITQYVKPMKIDADAYAKNLTGAIMDTDKKIDVNKMFPNANEQTNSSIIPTYKLKMPEMFTGEMKTLAVSMGIKYSKLKAHIKEVHEKTGFSEEFIKQILAGETYTDSPRDIGDKTITVGFGHTRLKDKSITWSTEVTPEKAFNWLIADLNDFERIIKSMKINRKEKVGDIWNEIPVSIQEELMDVAYNRGPGNIKPSKIKKAVKKGNFSELAVSLKQPKKKMKPSVRNGLMKRNCYRVFLGIRDLDYKSRADAISEFEPYFQDACHCIRRYKDDVKKLKELKEVLLTVQ